MLRHPRPKSQPPIKFTSTDKSPLISSKQHVGPLSWAKLMHPQQVVAQLSPRACLGPNKTGELQKDDLDLSSASSSDSSASSLASSTLSLSTDSSTSTVLAALSSIKQQQKKIATVKTQENGSLLASQKQQLNRQQSSEEEEEEADQALSSASSSSSSSSSSGLSSMNSLSQTGAQSEDSSQLNSIDEAEEEDDAEPVEREDEVGRSKQVRQCLDDLVTQVSQQVGHVKRTSSQKRQANDYEGLHGAMLAHTSQHTTSGSSDEELGTVDISYSFKEESGEAYLVKSFDVKDLLSDSLLLHLARQCIISQSTSSSKWTVRLKSNESLLEWTPQNVNKPDILPFDRIIKHLVDGPMIVWLAQGAPTHELETTLDDIALALDEPVNQQVVGPPVGLSALVWLCCDERVAQHISDTFNYLKHHCTKHEEAKLYHINSYIKNDKCKETTSAAETSYRNSSKTGQQLECSGLEKQRRNEPENSTQTTATNSKVKSLLSSKLKDSNGSLGEQLDTPAAKEKASPKKTTEVAAFGRASYYKSVASRVISNGQHKIKSFRDEMIKFNRHSSNLSLNTTGLASGSGKRGSRLFSSKESNHCSQVVEDVQRQKLSSCTDLSYGHNDSQAVNQTRSSLQSNNSNHLSNSCNQIPAVKPRTSILKRGDTSQAPVSASDNVKSIIGGSLLRRQNTLISTPGSTASRAPKELPKQPAQQQQLPRSILKNSKSVSNLASSDVNKKSEHEHTTRTRVDQQQLDAVPDTRSSSCGNMKKAASTSIHLAERRRSTYSLASKPVQFFDDKDDHDECGYNNEAEQDIDQFNFDSSQREQAFERIRRRASCYDVSRLMSKSNSIESQLTRLRSGSTNSISGKSRQRRPALLLGESEQEPADYSQSTMKQRQLGVKGRAYGSTVGYEASVNGGRRQLKLRQQEALFELSKTKGLLAESSELEKKSEFDPRSLRRIKPVSSSTAKKDARQLLESQTLKIIAKVPVATDDTNNIRPYSIEQLKASKKLESQNYKSVPTQAEADESTAEDSEETSQVEEVQVSEEDPQPISSSSLSKKGPFSLLRQSFNQKTLSSMLKFSTRASMRWKPAELNASDADKMKQKSSDEANSSNKSDQTATAIAQAEANLIAARQLKQQAQKLKEQEKRELQLQQQQVAEQRNLMLAAVQYNQQMQQQHHHQHQQQLVYQQAFAAQQYARAQMFDSAGLQFQHQMMFQRQQQQQIAQMSSAQQYMVAQHQLALIQQQHHQPFMCPTGRAPSGADLFRTGTIRGTHKLPVAMHPAAVQPAQQMLPMSVNHHSSFNIVYAGGPGSHLPVAQPAMDVHPMVDEPAVVVSSRSGKQSSLGQSMRKTVKSILNSKTQSGLSRLKAAQVAQVESKEIKSALKSVSTSRDLNSEGSDGDTGSSSDSATTSHKPSSLGATVAAVPKSALKKSANHTIHIDQLSTSYQSTTGAVPVQRSANQSTNDTSPKYRQSIRLNQEDVRLSVGGGSPSGGSGSDSNGSNSTGKTGAGNGRRKNVTFSTKLTSIL